MKSIRLRLLTYIFKRRLWCILAISGACVSTALNVISPIIIGRVIDCITTHDSASAWKLIHILILVYIFYSFSNWLMMYAANRIAFTIGMDLRKQLYYKLEHMPIVFYDTNAKGDIITRFVNDIDNISEGFLQGLSTMLSGIATIVLTMYFMLRINTIMSIIVMISAPFTYGIAYIITKRSRIYFTRQANALGIMNSYGEEMLSGIKTIKAYHYESDMKQTYHAYNQALYTYGVKSQFYGSLPNPSTRFVMNIAYSIVGFAGALMTLYKSISIGDISSFLMYSNLFSKPFTEITGVITQLQTAMASAKRVFEILDMDEESDDQLLPEIQVNKGSVDFNHVWFSYDEAKPLMKNIELHIQGGSRIAVVGKSGAGKTTLVNLLLRFYDIQDGSICIDGQIINQVNRDSLRRNFAMVLQDTYLFEGSIADNIAYGFPDAKREDVVLAAKRSGAHDFIRRLDNGYDTLLYTSNHRLSQGQRQLLSISRALLMNPSILILDEATSSIDTLSEQHVQQAMKVLMEGKTCFIIAHRLSTIIDADCILVMEHGNIIEQGTHDQLLKNNGNYAQLYRSQFS